MARKPDYSVNALNKETGEKARVGAAWLNSDGTISISLNHFVQLTASSNLVITLFHVDETRTDSKEPF